MTTGMLIRTLFEVVLIAVVIVGYFHNERLAKWEKKILAKLKGDKHV